MTLRRRDFLVGAALGLAAGSPAVAQDFVSSIVRQLRQQGFRTVLQERTLLGRIRITATRQDGRREIIVNPRTGEILRDLWMPSVGGNPTVDIIEDNSDDDTEDGGEDGGDDDGDDGSDDSGDDGSDDGDDSSGSDGDDDDDDGGDDDSDDGDDSSGSDGDDDDDDD